MTADGLLQILSQAIYVAIFVSVTLGAVRWPLRANVDIALLFGALGLEIMLQWLRQSGLVVPSPLLSSVDGSLLLAIPYLTLRLLDDFTSVPGWLMNAAAAGLGIGIVTFFSIRPLPMAAVLLMVLYIVALEAYAAVAFLREGRRARGVTGRRMIAVATGSACLGLVFVVAGLGVFAPQWGPVWLIIARLAGLASGVFYFLGFAPPVWLRRAWQEPELRSFLSKAATLPRLPTTEAIIEELERGAAAALGAPRAAIGKWQSDSRTLVYPSSDPSQTEPVVRRDDALIPGRAFKLRQPVFSANAIRDDPEHADVYRRYGALAVLAAPIIAGTEPLGVLTVYGRRASIFAEDDLRLVVLLADQAAVILESRALIDEAAAVRAREQATRMKDDFLSAAAHDLKTPLTALLAQAQLMERRLLRDPNTPADMGGLRRIISEARRLSSLVIELLDASRAEQGRLLGTREPVDVTAIAAETCARHHSQRHTCVVDSVEPVVGLLDRQRIAQLLENLVENAVKYSPDGGEIVVTVRRMGDRLALSVRDRGIGIVSSDLPLVFERFQRGANVDHRRFVGMGLGLYICRAITEQHGGHIWAESVPERGSIFNVELPLVQPAQSVREVHGAAPGAAPSTTFASVSAAAEVSGGA